MTFLQTIRAVALGLVALPLAALADDQRVGGIGIAITRNSPLEPLRVVQVVRWLPADAAGIKTNCFLISVDGTNVAGMSPLECMGLLRGPVATTVTLELTDPARRHTNKVTLQRTAVKLPDDPRAPPPPIVIH